jgi:hypothetical protein
MFSKYYFALRQFAARYFAKIGAVPPRGICTATATQTKQTILADRSMLMATVNDSLTVPAAVTDSR